MSTVSIVYPVRRLRRRVRRLWRHLVGFIRVSRQRDHFAEAIEESWR